MADDRETFVAEFSLATGEVYFRLVLALYSLTEAIASAAPTPG